jgi:hypothetical protein
MPRPLEHTFFEPLDFAWMSSIHSFFCLLFSLFSLFSFISPSPYFCFLLEMVHVSLHPAPKLPGWTTPTHDHELVRKLLSTIVVGSA